MRFDDAHEALAWLRRATADPGAEATLRRFLADVTGEAPAAWERREAVLQRVAALLVSGRVTAEEHRAEGLAGFGGAADEGEEEAAEAQAKAPVEERAEESERRTWITVELVGEDDQPIPGERWRVVLPDGSVREGVLDGRGLARIFDIEAGQCEITFPNLDQDAWTPIGTSAEP